MVSGQDVSPDVLAFDVSFTEQLPSLFAVTFSFRRDLLFPQRPRLFASQSHIFAERINRHISLSRHNSIFFGSHEVAKRGCVFYSLTCSCRNNGINFFDYLSDVLNKAATLPSGSPAEAYRDRLPDKWTKNEQGQ